MSSPWLSDHWVSQPALRIQPLPRLLRQALKVPLLKELYPDTGTGSLVGNRFRTVFAKFRVLAAFQRFWPGATGAIKSAHLVDL